MNCGVFLSLIHTASPKALTSKPSKAPPSVVAKLPDGFEFLVQVNFCKNPKCPNFGIPPSLPKGAHRSKAAPGTPGVEYTLSSPSRRGARAALQLRCDLCRETPPIKNNEGLAQVLNSMSAHTEPPPPVSCPKEDCPNHGVPFSKALYISYGHNTQGSKRWKCRACGKTFSVPTRSTIRQRVPHKNSLIFRLLVNKSPIQRICEIADIAPKTFYDRLDFIHKRSLAFSGKFDRQIPQLNLDRLYIAVDRQDYVINWAGRKDKRNVTLHGLGSADLVSGFVLGMHLNFDRELDSQEIERDAKEIGDTSKDVPLRKYSWLLLEADYAAHTIEAARRKRAKKPSLTLDEGIAATYEEAAIRSDIEEPRPLSQEEKLPAKGMQVRADYTLYAHFLWLKAILRNVGKLRFYMDQESGIRAACLSAFHEEIKDRRCDAFYVRLGKEMTVDEKRKVQREARARFQAFADAHTGLSPEEVKIVMMLEEMKKAAAFGKWSDRWVRHPWPDSAEPEKAMCYLTDVEDLDEEHLARLYMRGSLHSIDRFFMLLRRRVSLLERSIGTSSKAGRSWHGYSAYNPANVQKVLDIFRTFYNFCLKGKDGKTPAMRLGLADRVYTPSDILT